MENEKSEHVIRSAVAGATRMPSDGTDDDEVRERGVVPEVCVHWTLPCGLRAQATHSPTPCCLYSSILYYNAGSPTLHLC